MTINDRYILDADGNPKLEPDLRKWAEWYETSSNRHVAEDYVRNARVSTIFLGLDHGFHFLEEQPGPPVLWETMIFDGDHGEHDLYQQRYTSREAAIAGHQEAVELVRNAKSNQEA